MGLTQIHGTLLAQMLETGTAYDATGNAVKVHSHIPLASVTMIQELIREGKPRRCLEVGFAMGVSALAILYALQRLGTGAHTVIDPEQTDAQSWNGVGLSMVARADLAGQLEFIEAPSHLALPRLLSEGRTFDFVFIDGWHSFDYAFVDYFFADLLLVDGGILIFDDVDMPQVRHVCRFLETHKCYETLGPRTPAERSTWGTIGAYRKLKSTRIAWDFHQSDYYYHPLALKLLYRVNRLIRPLVRSRIPRSASSRLRRLGRVVRKA